MKINLNYVEIAVAANIIIGVATVFWFLPKPDSVRYDCSISEISPDFPVEAKEACRKLRANKI